MVDVHVNLATKDVHVKYRRDGVSPRAMRQAVERVDLRLRVRHWLHQWLARLSAPRR